MWALLRKNCQCDNVFPLNDVVPFPLLPEKFYRWFKRGPKKVASEGHDAFRSSFTSPTSL